QTRTVRLRGRFSEAVGTTREASKLIGPPCPPPEEKPLLFVFNQRNAPLGVPLSQPECVLPVIFLIASPCTPPPKLLAPLPSVLKNTPSVLNISVHVPPNRVEGVSVPGYWV